MCIILFIVLPMIFIFTLQVVGNKSNNEVPRDTPDLDEEMERVFAGVSSGSGTNRFDLARFTGDRSPKPGGRRFSEDDYTGKSWSIISSLVCRWFQRQNVIRTAMKNNKQVNYSHRKIRKFYDNCIRKWNNVNPSFCIIYEV